MQKTRWNHRIARILAIVALGGLPALVGCGGADNAGSPTASSASTTNAPTQTAAAEVVQNGVGTEPAHCVAIFLDSLRSGDEAAANGVLTTKAREELAKTAYEMQPLGTPQGKFEIGRVGYPFPEDKSIALVECEWSEPPVEGQEPLRMDIVCEVHKESQGWRISGLGVNVPGSEETLVLDFEDAAALQATIDAATGAAPTNQQMGTPSRDPIAGAGTGVPAQTVSGTPSALKSESETSAPAYPPLPGYPANDGGSLRPAGGDPAYPNNP